METGITLNCDKLPNIVKSKNTENDVNSTKQSYKNKNLLFLQQLNEKNKKKQEDQIIKSNRIDKIVEKHKEALGLNKVKPKIFEDGQLPEIKLSNRPNTTLEATNECKIESNINQNKIEIIKEKKKKKKKKTKKKKSVNILNNELVDYNYNSNKELISEKIKSKEKFKEQINLKNCNSLEDWKRRNKIDKDQTVFVCYHGFPDMRKALLQRGFVENPDQNSIFFDIKMVLSGKNVNFQSLEKNQIVNHFQRNGELTRKGNLCKNIRNLHWFRNVNINSFYPRSFDLSDMNDVEVFCEDFKSTKAQSILYDYLYDKRIISKKMLNTAISICERKLQDINDIIDAKGPYYLITNKEWDIICEEYDNPQSASTTDTNKEKKRSKSSSLKIINNNNKDNIFADIKNGSKIQTVNHYKFEDSKNEDSQKTEVKQILDKFASKDLQHYLNGHRNTWIMKPSGLSRGRGIKCTDSLSYILTSIKSGCNQFVIQKYIENPLIIMNKKFDIRQWVLVTNFNPLTIWMYDEYYIRFGAEDYNPSDMINLFSHLTNNSIAVKSKKFECSLIEENMWSLSTFSEFLSRTYHSSRVEEIKNKIRDIIIYTLESVQDLVENRKNSHEIFGFDLMVDDKFNVWLIEVNSSPCMEYSTEVTKRLVKLVMEDTCKVVLDNSKTKLKDDMNVDMGKWQLIHKAKFIEETTVPVGFNLVCEGTKIKNSSNI